jgi:hypothetical protein
VSEKGQTICQHGGHPFFCTVCNAVVDPASQQIPAQPLTNELLKPTNISSCASPALRHNPMQEYERLFGVDAVVHPSHVGTITTEHYRAFLAGWQSRDAQLETKLGLAVAILRAIKDTAAQDDTEAGQKLFGLTWETLDELGENNEPASKK